VPLQPKRVKYRKTQKGRLKGKASRGVRLNFGDYGLIALESCRITARQIEAARVSIVRCIKEGGEIWIRIFPHKPVTKKPLDTRMGKGKGEVALWVAQVQPGRVLFELGGVKENEVKKAFTMASHKLPIKTKIISFKDESILL